MAIRYAGDVTITLQFVKGRYKVSFRAPGLNGNGTLTLREVRLSHKEDPKSPEAYDKAAERVVGFLKAKGIHAGKIHRIFQAPCPIVKD